MTDAKLLNRKKNQISDISDFYVSSYGRFYDVITPIFDVFFTITLKIKIGKKLHFGFHSIQHISHHP